MKRLLSAALMTLTFVGAAFSQSIRADKHKGYQSIFETLRTLVGLSEKRAKRNTIFVSNVQNDGRDFAYAYWKEDNSITILHLPLTLPLKKYSLEYNWLTTKARIDLETDVVPTHEDIGGSSYLVDKAWVDKIKKFCVAGVRLDL